MSDNIKFYTEREEKLNYLTHLLGVFLAIVSAVFLIKKSMFYKDYGALIAYLVFVFGILACMLSSTLYHYTKEPKLKSKLRHFDHASIYLLIAASYTPFTIILLRGNQFWSILLTVLVWLMAVVGIAISFRKLKKNSHLKTISYVAMGLTIVIAIQPLLEMAHLKDGMTSVYLLFIGGAFYIIGSVFYALAKREFIHAVFHIFVLFGLISHIFAAYFIPLV